MSERAESVLSVLSYLAAELSEHGEVKADEIIRDARTLIIELEAVLENQQRILHNKEPFAGHEHGPMEKCRICLEVLNFQTYKKITEVKVLKTDWRNLP